MKDLGCFKSYDIRGKVGETLDAGVATRIGRAFAQCLAPGAVVLGHDCRTTSPALAQAVAKGLCQQGVLVHDIGLAGTEEVYFATHHLGAGGGIEVTASHNPIEYNGMKLVGPGSRPLTDPEFQAVRAATAAQAFPTALRGEVRQADTRAAYAAHVAGMIDLGGLRPLKVLVNAGNGVAGPAFDAIAGFLGDIPLEFVRQNHTPDGRFPNGIPNPLLPENQPQTAQAVRDHGCDLGVAWDGDFDRCFFFDHAGAFVPGEYVVALLGRAMLARHPGAAIVHDHRVILNTRAVVQAAGGIPVTARTGHAFMKATMRAHDAVYGGEMSAHHYFRDFMYCDSGMIPMLKMLELISTAGQSLQALVADMQAAVASSGEVNFPVANALRLMAQVAEHYADRSPQVDDIDGLSLRFEDWRLNMRCSSTEPLLRLNIESPMGAQVVQDKLAEVCALLRARPEGPNP